MTYLFQLLKVYRVRRGRAAHYFQYVIILLRHHMLYITTQLAIILNGRAIKAICLAKQILLSLKYYLLIVPVTRTILL